MKIEEALLLKEISYKAVLSSGPGGQHVNKTSSKVVLEWNLADTQCFSPEEIQRLQTKLSSYLNKENTLQISCSETRSQHKNKELVTQRFFHLLHEGLKRPKKRKKPKPGKKFHKNRLQEKKRQAEKKQRRKNPLE